MQVVVDRISQWGEIRQFSFSCQVRRKLQGKGKTDVNKPAGGKERKLEGLGKGEQYMIETI